MKTPTYLLGLFSLSSMSASAFTVDFNALSGAIFSSSSPNSISVPIAGYGDVVLTAELGSTLEVNEEFTNDLGDMITAVRFDGSDAVTVQFNGSTPLNVDFDYVGISVGENLNASATSSPTSFDLAFSSADPDAAAGLRSISFDSVPEPSTALLGCVSLLGLLRRQR